MSTDATPPHCHAAELATVDALGTQLTRFARVLHRARARWSQTDPGGLEQSAFAILAALIVDGPQRTSALAELLQTEISTVSRQTGSLVQLGLIQRQADPEDGRVCVLGPTDQGRQVFDRARAARNRWLATTMQDWDPCDVERLTTLLRRLNADLITHESGLADGPAHRIMRTSSEAIHRKPDEID